MLTPGRAVVLVVTFIKNLRCRLRTQRSKIRLIARVVEFPGEQVAGDNSRVAQLSAPRVTSAVKRPSPSGMMTKRPRA